MNVWRRAGTRSSWVPAVGTRTGWGPRYELIGCALKGHMTVPWAGRAPDAALARHMNGLWWDRCLRCDAWLPRPDVPLRRPRRGPMPTSPHPDEPSDHLPSQRHGVVPPIRGRLLRDKYVLRLIAIDRAVHVLALAALGVAVSLFAAHQTYLRELLTRLIDAFQGPQGTARTTIHDSGHGLTHYVALLTSLHSTSLHLATAAVWAYALLELVEAVGLWFARRWAEYLTLVATTALVPVELYELTEGVTWLKVAALSINLAIVAYLLVAKRLFGLRGGAAAEERERLADSGWLPVERATPPGSSDARARDDGPLLPS